MLKGGNKNNDLKNIKDKKTFKDEKKKVENELLKP
jgi:hypothetical protein